MTCYVTHLESALDGTRFEAGAVHTVHQGRPLWVRYDLDRRPRRPCTPDDLARPAAVACGATASCCRCRWTPSR